MNRLPPESFFSLVVSTAGPGSKPAEGGVIQFRCGCGKIHSVLIADGQNVRGDLPKAFVLPCPETRHEAILTLVERRGVLWWRRLEAVASTFIGLGSLADFIASQATAHSQTWLDECASDLQTSSYRHEPLHGFEIRSDLPTRRDLLRISGFAIYNLLMWLQREGYFTDEAILQIRATFAEGGSEQAEIEAASAYNERTHANAGARLYDSFVGLTTKLLTGSNSNAGRLVVEGNLLGLLLPFYATVAKRVGDTSTADALQAEAEALQTKVTSYASA